MTYEQALDYIHSRIHRGTRKGMPRMRLLMEKLGDPQKRLRIVHVAGSNGKGSTCTMLESVLRQAGYRTGLFVSPFVFDFRERIQLCGELVDKKLMADTLERMLPVFDEMKALDQECTEFETLTALAFVIFAEAGVDAAVIEVGIGGLLDCTNVIDPPVLAVIGAISLEHTEILGNTIPEIAAQKCGIIKPGCRVAAYCDLHPQARAVLEETCASFGITPRLADPAALEVLEESDRGSRFCYGGEEYFVPLAGRHQVYNALTVLSAAEELREAGFDLPVQTVQKGLAATRFVGRLQIVRKAPKCILDGAHNPGKIKALAEALDELYPEKTLICVMGIMQRKDYHAAIPPMASRSRVFIAVPAENFSGGTLPPEETASIAARFCGDVRICSSAEAGARLALRLAGENDVIVACGSMYLLGDAKRGFTENEAGEDGSAAGKTAFDLTVEKVEKGTPLADELLRFVETCSWEETKEHIAELIREWRFTDWETMFAARADGKIVGMVSTLKTDYYPLPEICPWVSCLFVTEEYRGRRISETLIDCANDYLKSLGFDRSYIPSELSGLYERYGYRCLREIVNYGGGTDHLFVKELK